MEILQPPLDAPHLSPGGPEWNVALFFPPRGEWTEADYLALPTNLGAELVDGCLELLPVPTESHQDIAAFLYEALKAFVRVGRLGKVLFMGIPVRVVRKRMRQPDVVFMRRENANRRREQFWDGADLAIEVVSPTGRERDLVEKRQDYARAGIGEYWIVDPQHQRIHVLQLDGKRYREAGVYGVSDTAASVTLPGFEVSVAAVFASPDED